MRSHPIPIPIDGINVDIVRKQYSHQWFVVPPHGPLQRSSSVLRVLETHGGLVQERRQDAGKAPVDQEEVIDVVRLVEALADKKDEFVRKAEERHRRHMRAYVLCKTWEMAKSAHSGDINCPAEVFMSEVIVRKPVPIIAAYF